MPKSPTTRAALVALLVGVAVMCAKFGAYQLTNSTAVLSDALESIVNVFASGFGLFAVYLSNQPPDENHPYGHGKVEFLAAALEGGMVSIASLLIFYEAAVALVSGGEIHEMGIGLVVVAGAGAVNAVLGFALVRIGKEHHSAALEADGRHILSDVFTSAAAVVGLGLVWMTGEVWIDAAVAIVAALVLLRMGFGLVRDAVGGIMDATDIDDIQELEAALHALDEPNLRGFGRLRSRHQGPVHHVDLVIYVPGELSVREGHDIADRVESALAKALDHAEVICHVEPASERIALEEGAPG